MGVFVKVKITLLWSVMDIFVLMNLFFSRISITNVTFWTSLWPD